MSSCVILRFSPVPLSIPICDMFERKRWRSPGAPAQWQWQHLLENQNTAAVRWNGGTVRFHLKIVNQCESYIWAMKVMVWAYPIKEVTSTYDTCALPVDGTVRINGDFTWKRLVIFFWARFMRNHPNMGLISGEFS